ncbi:MAG: tail fiber domain-containing protein [Planctomycetes bacterium]|nr:tail fiber domain-containing protein [Planctomycetota bacterium]
MKSKLLMIASCLLLIFLSNVAWAQTSKDVIPLSGVMTDNLGNALSGSQTVLVTIFDSADPTANILFEEQHEITPSADGSYSLSIGAGINPVSLEPIGGIPENALTGDSWYLGISVNSEEMTPRLLLTSALFAINTSKLGGYLPPEYVKTSGAGYFSENVDFNNKINFNGNSLFHNEVEIGGNAKLTGTNDYNGEVVITGDAYITGLVYYKGQPIQDVFVDQTGDTMTGTLNLPDNGLTVGGNQIYLDNNRVGIGTSNPYESLDVAGGIRIGNTTGTNTGTIRFDGAKFEGYTSSGWANLCGSWMRSGNNLYYNNGNVGIGTSSPQGTFHVVSQGIVSGYDQQSTYRYSTYFCSPGSTYYQSFIPAVTGRLTTVEMYGRSYSGYRSFRAYIYDGYGTSRLIYVSSYHTITTSNTWHRINTSVNLTAGRTYSLRFYFTYYAYWYYDRYNYYTRGRASVSSSYDFNFRTTMEYTGNIDSICVRNGSLGINTTNPSSSYQLYVYGTAYFSGGYTSSSDLRFKKNIKTIDDALDRLRKMKGVYYRWREDKFDNKTIRKDRQMGFIAQEMERILPEVVMTDENGYKAISYDRIAAVVTEAIKQQQHELSKLSSDMKTMRKIVSGIISVDDELAIIDEIIKQQDAQIDAQITELNNQLNK